MDTSDQGVVDVERLAGSCGAIVRGLDLGRPRSPEQIETVLRLLDEHLVVAFAGQRFDLDRLEAFTDELGGRDVTPYVTPVDGRPYVIRVIKEPDDELNFANAWHTDLSYLAAPPAYTVLHAADVPAAGGDTMWANQHLAYETLLNTDLRRELDQLGRFLSLVVEHKYAIGFEGTILLEPKPFEPTKHQYDYDVAAVHAFLQKYGLADEIKVNIEVNHATLAGHDFAHEIAAAFAGGIFGSIDANAGDDRLGWDVDRFPVSVEQMTLGMVELLRGGGFTTGGMNFDAKLRRQSIDRNDLFHAHIGGMDTLARSLLAAASILEAGELDGIRDARYAKWDEAADVLDGKVSLRELHDRQLGLGEPTRVSGRQEELENLVARYVERAR